MMPLIFVAVLLLGGNDAFLSSFVPRCHLDGPVQTAFGVFKAQKSSWTVDDDWARLSQVENEEIRPQSGQDLVAAVAKAMEQPLQESLSEEEEWISDKIEDINHWPMDSGPLASNIYDIPWDDDKQITFEDEMGREISLLVRCNQSPEDMLIEGGRALPPLTEQERNDLSQLVTVSSDGGLEPTDFFRDAIQVMFREHSDEHGVMRPSGVASWMSKSLEDTHVSSHDKRVLSLITRFSTYGTGYLTLENFENLYITALTAALDAATRFKTGNRMGNVKGQPTVETIWRDIRNHNILSPTELEREIKLREVLQNIGADISNGAVTARPVTEDVMDECELSEIGHNYATTTFQTPQYKEKELSSHELVEIASDGKTPLYLRDGDFIFIDEESCVGCLNCINASPASFLMLDNGRARTYLQRNNAADVDVAVETCPVNCMHRVSFDELKELETAREHGDGRSDHRHLGNTPKRHIPLYVAGIESDANKKSSWYHYLKQKCFRK
jgi:ferredoxin